VIIYCIDCSVAEADKCIEAAPAPAWLIVKTIIIREKRDVCVPVFIQYFVD
jgi:hypothetical protein